MMSVTYEFNFRVRAKVELGEVVCVVGDCRELGKWNPHYAVELTKESSSRIGNRSDEEGECPSSSQSPCDKQEKNIANGDIWWKRVKFSGLEDFSYRFFVCQKFEPEHEEEDRLILIRRWETNIEPRTFSPKEYLSDSSKFVELSLFGEYGGKYNITKGWLTGQTEIHVRFHNNPIRMWKPSYRQQVYSVKCTAMDHRFHDYNDENEDEEDVPATFTNVYISVLNQEGDTPRLQGPYGTVSLPSEYLIFSAQTFEPEYLGFRMDFFVHDPEAPPEVKPRLVAYSYILPLDVKTSNFSKTIPITGLKHKPIGQVTLDFFLAKPITGIQYNMEVSYQTYWKYERGSVDVGHRGMGSSYKHKKLAAVRENTITSLVAAASHGAHFVEFDVQLSKDLVPVIYHDFQVCITYRKKKREELQLFQIPVKDLTLSELQSMQLSHTSHLTESHPDITDADDLDPADLQPFPTLQQCFTSVDVDVGFNVEVKYPLQTKDGTYEQDHFFDRNKFVDMILKVVYSHAGSRRIIFSSFDADTCTLLQLKQNKYPVLFLTTGETTKYAPYMDLRTRTVNMAVHFAKSQAFLGIDVFSDVLLKENSLIQKIKDRQLVLFCWGEDNNSTETINALKELRVDGIIYDRWILHGFTSQMSWEDAVYTASGDKQYRCDCSTED